VTGKIIVLSHVGRDLISVPTSGPDVGIFTCYCHTPTANI